MLRTGGGHVEDRGGAMLRTGGGGPCWLGKNIVITESTIHNEATTDESVFPFLKNLPVKVNQRIHIYANFMQILCKANFQKQIQEAKHKNIFFWKKYFFTVLPILCLRKLNLLYKNLFVNFLFSKKGTFPKKSIALLS